MALATSDNINETVATLEHRPGLATPVDLPTKLAIDICGSFDDFSIYYWDELSDKSHCFDYGKLVSVRKTEDCFGTDIGIVPSFFIDNIRTRDLCDNNNRWVGALKLMRSKLFERC